MEKFKLVVSIIFFIIGIVAALYTFQLTDNTAYGKRFSNDMFNPTVIAGSGVDSSNDGVAIGFGIISGLSFLSSTLLISSIKNKGE